MKVVFIASHTQKSDLGMYYSKINELLVKAGHKVFSGSLFNDDKGDVTANKREAWYREVLSNVKSADFVVIEISYPSTANVGHILTYALDIGKPVVALYHEDREPLFLQGRIDERLTLLSYKNSDLESVLSSGLDYVASAQDVRFNFFISPNIGTYLDWISKNRRIPRAVYLRRLIEEDMNNNGEYKDSN